MKRNTFKVISALIIIIVFFASCQFMNTLPDEYSFLKEPAKLKELIDSGKMENFIIVDVRPISSYESGHIPTAINIPNGDLEKVGIKIDKNKYLILYCETGGRAEMAGRKLKKSGYKFIMNWGGYTRWPYEFEKVKPLKTKQNKNK